MTNHRFTDTMTHDARIRATDDGAVVQAKVARAGNVQAYLGSEIGMVDRAVVRVYRPVDEVFDKVAISTYARKPVTIGHPEDGVSPDTWKDLAVGEIDRDVMRDGEFVSVPLLFRDAKAIAMLQSLDGPRELSMGYDAAIRMEDGVSPNGEPYDAVMTDFRMNHVAVVAKARGGEELRIGDGAATWGATPIQPTADTKGSQMTDTLQTVVLGDQAAQVAVADAPKFEAFKTAQAKLLADAEKTHTDAIAAKDEEIGTLKADLKKAQDAAITPEKMTKLVADRVTLETTVHAIDKDIKVQGVSDADLRKAAVSKALGADMVTDASDAEIAGMFKAVAKDAAKGDQFADHLAKNPPLKDSDDPANARAKMIADMQSATAAA